MAKKPSNPNEEAARIAEREMPGWKAVPADRSRVRGAQTPDSEGAPPTHPDAVLPSLGKLRKKYLGHEQPEDPEADALEAAAGDETELVEMESGELRKTVAVRKGKIVWSQG